jgi:uncharacterized membrane protein
MLFRLKLWLANQYVDIILFSEMVYAQRVHKMQEKVKNAKEAANSESSESQESKGPGETGPDGEKA